MMAEMDAFQIAKFAGLLATPSTLGVVLLVLGLVLGLLRLRLAGRVVLYGLAAAVVAVAALPVGDWLARPLEDRFPRPDWPACVDGIVVLSSGERPLISRVRGTPVYSQNQGAIVAGAELMRRYLKARLVFTGGSGAASGTGLPAADVARGVAAQLGLDATRIAYEERSRNTWENLLFTKEMVQPKAGEVWLLVAAAMHMPRSMGVAQQLGWPMIAWPTDYRTLGQGQSTVRHLKFSRGLFEIDDAAHEWLGLLGYRVEGRIGTLFPSPALAADQTCVLK